MTSRILRELKTPPGVYSGWIAWNLFLAFIPLALSFWLFRRRTNARSFLWWVAFVVFLAFLPNAPYVLTDIIHLLRGAQDGESILLLALVYVPLHGLAILAGFEAYVISLLNLGHYLKRQGAQHLVVWAELLMHLLCAIGIFMGRFRRFNSWDLVVTPSNVIHRTLDDLTSKRPVLVIVLTFVILTVLYWLIKQVTLGVYLRIREARLKKRVD